LQTLHSLQRQTQSDFEILAVDNAADPEIERLVSKFNNSAKIPVWYISEPRSGVHYARNRAAECAEGDLLLYTDDDVSLEPDWVKAYAKAFAQWMPKTSGTFRGEEGLLHLGLDFGAFSPGTIFKVAASREIGGFVEIDGVCADYPFSVRLAFSYGMAFFRETIGRFRIGHAQASDYSTPEKAEDFLDFIMREGEHLIRSVGCSRRAAEQIVDYTTWETFLKVAPPWLRSDESFVFRLTRKCLRASPRRGEWQNRARQHYPFLFWPLSWLTWPLFQASRSAIPAPVRRWLRAQVG
jgi:glycosyltransferase involved in cell wall biosynthesis